MSTTMPLSTANWHWKNKNVTNWGHEYFKRELVAVQVSEGGQSVEVDEVTDIDGDVELGQRKSKLITIYDCAVELKWKGTAEDGTEVNGKLKIPEVSHEITLDGLSDYVYNWSLSSSSSPAAQSVFSLAKSRLPAALEVVFKKFPVDLVETHGKDIQITNSTANSADPSRSTTPAPAAAASSSTASQEKKAPTVVKQKEKPVNTSRVTAEAQFMASADDLFDMLTNETRIPMWTRAPAQSTPEPGAPFSLFGGGVKGTYEVVERPKKFVQKWALESPTWPSGHYATLTATFDQSSDSTKLELELDGVPLSMEDELKRNIEGYYIQGLKSIGYVPVQFIDTPSNPLSSSKYRNRTPESELDGDSSNSARTIAIVLACMVLVGAISIPFLHK